MREYYHSSWWNKPSEWWEEIALWASTQVRSVMSLGSAIFLTECQNNDENIQEQWTEKPWSSPLSSPISPLVILQLRSVGEPLKPSLFNMLSSAASLARKQKDRSYCYHDLGKTGAQHCDWSRPRQLSQLSEPCAAAARRRESCQCHQKFLNICLSPRFNQCMCKHSKKVIHVLQLIQT